MCRDTTIDSLSRDYGASVISGFGVVLLGLLGGWWVVFRATIDLTDLALSVAMVGVPAVGLVWGGTRLDRSGIDPARYDRIGRWTLGGAIGFLLVNAVIIVVYPWYSQSGNLIWAHWATTIGAVGGFVIGYVEARAIQQEVEATATAVRAEQLEAEREMLGYLNDLLRHEVLNSAQIIDGYTSLLLAEDPDDRTRTHLETIQDESDSLEIVIGDVRAMLEANQNPNGSSSLDLSDLLEETADMVRYRYEDAEIELTVPTPVFVSGNDGLAWVFSNLLENGIEHNDSETPRVDVDIETTAETVVVTVTDNGPGIDPGTRERLFERKSRNHGLGLYLTRVLTNRYDGTVELGETGPDGTTVTVTLPRASTEPR